VQKTDALIARQRLFSYDNGATEATMAIEPLDVIGDPQNHDQHAQLIISGRLDYACDRLPLVKLYGAIKASSIAHGTIKSIDASRALKEPGVKAVITYNECPIWSQGIFQWGQEVAGVVADDPATAARATTLIQVSYSTSKAVFDPDEAMKKDAPLVGVNPTGNVTTTTSLVRGEGGPAGLKKADLVLETTQPWSTSYQHGTLETHQAVAWWVGPDVYIWCPSQNIFNAKYIVVNALQMSTLNVHLFSHGTGSALGDKNKSSIATVAAVMSRAVGGMPVQIVLSRHDNTLFNTRQFAVRSVIRLGAKQDGTLTGIDAQFWGDGGRNPVSPVNEVAYGLRTTYLCPDATFGVTKVVTNNPERGFWRCVQDPPGAFNYDMALDKLADKLGINPYALRSKNLRAADAPDQDPPYRVWGGNGVALCFEKVHTESEYDFKWHKPGTRTLPDGRLHGIAITGHLDSHGYVVGATRGGIIIVTADGKAFLTIGGARASDGGPTVCAHIVAETLGMKYEDVRVGEWGSTDVSLDSGMQAGSTFTASAGSAFLNAALEARGKLFAAAVAREPCLSRKASVDDLDARESAVFLKSDPATKITLRQVMSGTGPIAGTGVGWNGYLRSRAVGKARLGDACNTSGSAATCAEVAVDADTGEVEILGLWNAVDTGRTIFKQGAIKEMSAGCELMAFQALFAGDTYDGDTGACLNSDYVDSLFPTTLDLPTERFRVFDVESDDAAGPYGAHGMGEPCVSNYSAIINAIFNATGKWVDPDKGAVTPNKVLKALGKG
jgi:CO/xanthine dehydrogenase Mo-binding subunit